MLIAFHVTLVRPRGNRFAPLTSSEFDAYAKELAEESAMHPLLLVHADWRRNCSVLLDFDDMRQDKQPDSRKQRREVDVRAAVARHLEEAFT
jgi:hypothetical protein